MTNRIADPAALTAAGISIAAMDRHAQVKKNLEPELPRPNPVRLPTRRELYGIRIPSQRDAELQRRQEEASQREQVYQQWSAEQEPEENVKTDDELEQERLLRVQFWNNSVSAMVNQKRICKILTLHFRLTNLRLRLL